MLIANALMLLINIHTDASGEARGIKCVLSLYLHSYFVLQIVYISSKGSGESMHMHTHMSFCCWLTQLVPKSHVLAHILLFKQIIILS